MIMIVIVCYVFELFVIIVRHFLKLLSPSPPLPIIIIIIIFYISYAINIVIIPYVLISFHTDFT